MSEASTGSAATTDSAHATQSGVEAGSGAAGVVGLVDLLTERALALSVQVPRAPSSVRISAGEVQVEICWPTGWADGVGQAGNAGQHGFTQHGATEHGASAPAGVAGHGGGTAAQAPVHSINGNGGHGTAAHPAAPDARADVFQLCAGTVGTFYRAPEPGAAPFVAEGDTVRPGQQVAIIEAMKLMIPVEAERPGEVVEFLVADRAPVEYGQPLMLLREAGK